jgi:glycosyltransferase involved in cell wall biosynthesis
MKIVHISTVHPAYDTRIFYKECISLQKHGFEVHLVIKCAGHEIKNNIFLHPVKNIKNKFLRLLFSPFFILRSVIKLRGDLYHFHDPELIFLGLLLKIMGKKVIYDVHEDVSAQILHKEWIPKKMRKIASFIIGNIENFSIRFFDGIVCATPYIKKKFDEKNKNTVCVLNTPLLEEGIDIPDQNKKEDSVCYAGNITKERGAIEMVNAMEGTNVTLYLAGSFYPLSLQTELEKLAGWKNIVYLGHLTREELYSVLGKCMAGLVCFHPIENHLHALPNKIFEYLNAGIIPIVSNIPMWELEFKNFGGVYFVEPQNSFSIKQAILQCIKEKEFSYQRGLLMRDIVRSHFNWKIEEKKLIELYQKIFSK